MLQITNRVILLSVLPSELQEVIYNTALSLLLSEMLQSRLALLYDGTFYPAYYKRLGARDAIIVSSSNSKVHLGIVGTTFDQIVHACNLRFMEKILCI